MTVAMSIFKKGYSVSTQQWEKDCKEGGFEICLFQIIQNSF